MKISQKAVRAYQALVKEEFRIFKENNFRKFDFNHTEEQFLSLIRHLFQGDNADARSILRELEQAGLLVFDGNTSRRRLRSLHMDLVVRIINMKTRPGDPDIAKYATDWLLFLDEDKIWTVPYLVFNENDPVFQEFKSTLLDFFAKQGVKEELAQKTVVVFCEVLKRRYPRGLYEYQFRAIKKQLQEQDVVHTLTAPTGAGKTEAFLIPLMLYVLAAKLKRTEGTSAIVFYPRKALSSDQASRFLDLVTELNVRLLDRGILKREQIIRVGILDGDTKQFSMNSEKTIPFRGITIRYQGKEYTLSYVSAEDKIVADGAPRIINELLGEQRMILGTYTDFSKENLLIPDILITNIWQAERFLANPLLRKMIPTEESQLMVVVDEFHLYPVEQRIFLGTLLNFLGRNRKFLKITMSSATPKDRKQIEEELSLNREIEIKVLDYTPPASVRETFSPETRLQIYLLLDMSPAFSWETMVSETVIAVTTLSEEKLTGVSRPLKSIVFIDNRSAIRRVLDNIDTAIRLGSPKDRVKLEGDPFENPETIKHYFVPSKIEAVATEDFKSYLRSLIDAHYSDYSLRKNVEESLKEGRLKTILATSTLEVGVDYKDVGLIMNAGIATDVSAIIQRAGRAGRSSDVANTSLVVLIARNHRPSEKMMYYLIRQKRKEKLSQKNAVSLKEILWEISKEFDKIMLNVITTENIEKLQSVLETLWEPEVVNLLYSIVKEEPSVNTFVEEGLFTYLLHVFQKLNSKGVVSAEELKLFEKAYREVVAKGQHIRRTSIPKMLRDLVEMVDSVVDELAEFYDYAKSLGIEVDEAFRVAEELRKEVIKFAREIYDLYSERESPTDEKLAKLVQDIRSKMRRVDSTYRDILNEIEERGPKETDFDLDEVSEVVDDSIRSIRYLLRTLEENLRKREGKIVFIESLEYAVGEIVNNISTFSDAISTRDMKYIVNAVISFFEALFGFELLTLASQTKKVMVMPSSDMVYVGRKLGLNVEKFVISVDELYYRFSPFSLVPIDANDPNINQVINRELSPFLGVMTYVENLNVSDSEDTVVYFNPTISEGISGRNGKTYHYFMLWQGRNFAFLEPFSPVLRHHLDQAENLWDFVASIRHITGRTEYRAKQSYVYHCNDGFAITVEPTREICPFQQKCKEKNNVRCDGIKKWHIRSKTRYPRIYVLKNARIGISRQDVNEKQYWRFHPLEEFQRLDKLYESMKLQEEIVVTPEYLLVYFPRLLGRKRIGRSFFVRFPHKITTSKKDSWHPARFILTRARDLLKYTIRGDAIIFRFSRVFIDSLYFTLLYETELEDLLKKLVVKYTIWSLSGGKAPYRMEIVIARMLERMKEEHLDEIIENIRREPYEYRLDPSKYLGLGLGYRKTFYYYFKYVLANTLARAILFSAKKILKDENDVLDVTFDVSYNISRDIGPILIAIYEKRISGPAGLLRTLHSALSKGENYLLSLLRDFYEYIRWHSEKYGVGTPRESALLDEFPLLKYVDYYVFHMFISQKKRDISKRSIRSLEYNEDEDDVDVFLLAHEAGIPVCSDGCPGCFVHQKYFDNLEVSRGLFELTYDLLETNDSSRLVSKTLQLIMQQLIRDRTTSKIDFLENARGYGSNAVVEGAWYFIESLLSLDKTEEIRKIRIDKIVIYSPFESYAENDLAMLTRVVEKIVNTKGVDAIGTVQIERKMYSMRNYRDIRRLRELLRNKLQDLAHKDEIHNKEREFIFTLETERGKIYKFSLTVSSTMNISWKSGEEQVNSIEITIRRI